MYISKSLNVEDNIWRNRNAHSEDRSLRGQVHRHDTKTKSPGAVVVGVSCCCAYPSSDNIISLGSLHLPLVASYNFCCRIGPGSDHDGVGILPCRSTWGIGQFLATTMSLIVTQESGLHFSSHHILYLCLLLLWVHMWILGQARAFFPCHSSLTIILLWFLLWKGVTAMDFHRYNL